MVKQEDPVTRTSVSPYAGVTVPSTWSVPPEGGGRVPIQGKSSLVDAFIPEGSFDPLPTTGVLAPWSSGSWKEDRRL